MPSDYIIEQHCEIVFQEIVRLVSDKNRGCFDYDRPLSAVSYLRSRLHDFLGYHFLASSQLCILTKWEEKIINYINAQNASRKEDAARKKEREDAEKRERARLEQEEHERRGRERRAQEERERRAQEERERRAQEERERREEERERRAQEERERREEERERQEAEKAARRKANNEANVAKLAEIQAAWAARKKTPQPNPVDTVQCPSCNKAVSKTLKFCTACGTKLLTECPNCKSWIKATMKFCTKCGTPLNN